MGEISVSEAPVRARSWPVLAAGVWLGLGAWAVTRWPLAGTAAFVLAALTLLWPRPAGAPAFGGIDLPAHPRQPWEIGFVVLLLALGVYSRAWDLNDTPKGAVTYEGEMRQDLSALSNMPYTPHSRHSINRWPTLLHYQALGMGKATNYQIWALRFPSAVWGLLSLLVFYLLIRRLTSPAAAAVASLFYAGSFLDILYARRVFPGTILHFSVMASLLCILQAAQLRREGKPAGRILAVGGVCLGLGLHAYYPGRGLPLLFALWFLWIRAFGHRPLGAKQQGTLWSVAALVAAPVLIWAWRNPVEYWGWIQQMNPNRDAGLTGYLRTFWGNLPEYLRMFHVAGDMLWEDNVARLPLLDPVAGALFATGLFMGLLFFWRPLPAFLLGLTAASMLPAILGGGFPHPNSRRAIMVTPAVFLFAGLASHQILTLARLRSAWLGRAALALLLALGAWSYAAGVHKTFVRFYQDPHILAEYNHMGWLANEEIRKHPQARILVSQLLRDGFSQAIFFPKSGPDMVLNDHEEILALEPTQDHLVLLEPFLVEALPMLKAVFPAVEWKVYDGRLPEATGQLDPYERRYWLVAGLMTAADIQSIKGWTDRAGNRVATGADGFGGAHAGKELDLRARLYLPEGAPRPVTFALDWPGAALTAGGRRVGIGRTETLTGGWHELRLTGMAPAGARGPLPFKILVNGRDIAPAAVVSFDWAHGMEVSYYEGPRSWRPGDLAFVRRELLPIRRYWDPMWLKHPYSVRAKAVLRVPGDGDYRLRVPLSKCMGRVSIDGLQVSSNLENRDVDGSRDITLKAGRPYRLEVDVDPNPILVNRNFALEVRRPGETEWISVPPTWLVPDAR